MRLSDTGGKEHPDELNIDDAQSTAVPPDAESRQTRINVPSAGEIPMNIQDLANPLKSAKFTQLSLSLQAILDSKPQLDESEKEILGSILARLISLRRSCEEKKRTDWVDYIDECIKSIEYILWTL